MFVGQDHRSKCLRLYRVRVVVMVKKLVAIGGCTAAGNVWRLKFELKWYTSEAFPITGCAKETRSTLACYNFDIYMNSF